MHKDKSQHSSKKEAQEDNLPTELLEHPSYKELQQKLDEAEAKANQYWDRLTRLQAETENTLRRVERDKANAHKYALEKFIGDLLPVVDSLDLCIASFANSKVDESDIEGVNMTLKMLMNVLEKYGVQTINPVSEQFDPERQQAISVQYDPNVKPGSVISVLQKGYTLNDRLLRPALVVVAKAEEE